MSASNRHASSRACPTPPATELRLRGGVLATSQPMARPSVVDTGRLGDTLQRASDTKFTGDSVPKRRQDAGKQGPGGLDTLRVGGKRVPAASRNGRRRRQSQCAQHAHHRNHQRQGGGGAPEKPRSPSTSLLRNVQQRRNIAVLDLLTRRVRPPGGVSGADPRRRWYWQQRRAGLVPSGSGSGAPAPGRTWCASTHRLDGRAPTPRSGWRPAPPTIVDLEATVAPLERIQAVTAAPVVVVVLKNACPPRGRDAYEAAAALARSWRGSVPGADRPACSVRSGATRRPHGAGSQPGHARRERSTVCAHVLHARKLNRWETE